MNIHVLKNCFIMILDLFRGYICDYLEVINVLSSIGQTEKFMVVVNIIVISTVTKVTTNIFFFIDLCYITN